MFQPQILAVRAAIAAKLRAAISPVPVEEHPLTKVTSDQLHQLLSDRHLVVRVSCLGNPREPADYDGEINTPFEWAAWICAKDGHSSKLSRSDLILSLLPMVMIEVAKAPLSGSFQVNSGEDSLAARSPRSIRSLATHEGEPGGNSDAIWMVSWQQTVDLKDVNANRDLRPFLELITKYDLAPKDGVIDATDVISMETP